MRYFTMGIDTKICAAFPGCGKTYICDNLTNGIKSIEIEYWKYVEKYNNIKHRNTVYLNDIRKHFGYVDYIFITTDPIGLKLLHENGFDNIILVYPLNELRNEYLDRYIARDSPHDFIGAYMKYWNTWLDELKSIKYCKHIILNSGEYLHDVLRWF